MPGRLHQVAWSKPPLAGARGGARACSPGCVRIRAITTGLQDGGNDLELTTAVRAVVDVDLKHAFEQPGPADARWPAVRASPNSTARATPSARCCTAPWSLIWRPGLRCLAPASSMARVAPHTTALCGAGVSQIPGVRSVANGFARVRCENCAHDCLVAYACKGRSVCPSCSTRHTALALALRRNWDTRYPTLVTASLRCKADIERVSLSFCFGQKPVGRPDPWGSLKIRSTLQMAGIGTPAPSGQSGFVLDVKIFSGHHRGYRGR